MFLKLFIIMGILLRENFRINCVDIRKFYVLSGHFTHS